MSRDDDASMLGDDESSFLRSVHSGESELHSLWIELIETTGKMALEQGKVLKKLSDRYLSTWRMEEIALVVRLVRRGVSLEDAEPRVCHAGLRKPSELASLYRAIENDLGGAQTMLKLFHIETDEPSKAQRTLRRRRREGGRRRTRTSAASPANKTPTSRKRPNPANHHASTTRGGKSSRSKVESAPSLDDDDDDDDVPSLVF